MKLVTYLAMMTCLSCLARDSRPVPGNVTLTVEPSDATLHGLMTSDGWAITFGRVVTAVGSVRLNDYPDKSTSCNDYYETNYDRLFDFTHVTAPQKVGLVFGLGKCSVGYRFRAPMSTDLIETGATAADVALMRTQNTDTAYGITGRIGLIVQGSATKNGVMKVFDFEFRRNTSVNSCKNAAGDGVDNVVDFKGNQAVTFDAEIRPEELFRAAPRDDAPFVFDPIASSVSDPVLIINLDSVASVPAPPGSTMSDTGAGGGGAGATGMGGAGGAGSQLPSNPSLGDVIYDLLLPRVSRIKGGGPCGASTRAPG